MSAENPQGVLTLQDILHSLILTGFGTMVLYRMINTIRNVGRASKGKDPR